MRLLFDCEADNLLDDATVVHCIHATDIDKGTKYDFGPTQIGEGVSLLNGADLLVAHNGLRYDYPLLTKLSSFNPVGRLWDSMVLSRLIKPDTKTRDQAQRRIPNKLVGSHTLKAWGLRLFCHKGDYEGPWDKWSQEMHDYCAQDVEVALKLWQHLEPDKYSQQAIELEHRIASVCAVMEQSGWPLDERAAGLLHAKLVEEKDLIEKKLKEEFGFWYESAGEFTPKADNKRFGYSKGIPVTKIKLVEFNPASRQHIYKRLMNLGWKPEEFTDSGQPQVDEAVLDQLAKEFPQADKLSRLLMLNKRIGQVATGKQAWLSLAKDGKIHAGYNTNGTKTGRSSHMSPNIAQVPKVGKPFGAECRALFGVPEGWIQIGPDQSGLEQRCLAHYTYPYDGGEYAKTSLEIDDIHWFHAKAIGIAEGNEDGDLRKILRDYTKTWFYAFLYGASDKKLTSILVDLDNELRKAGFTYTGVKDGKDSRDTFGSRIPALGELNYKVIKAAETKRAIKALDGRIIPFAKNESYKALNYLCQSAGAIICKEWVSSTYETLLAKGLKYGWNEEFTFLGWIHDELQVAVRQKDDNVKTIKDTLIECGRGAGTRYGFKVPLDVECKEGSNWAETH